MGPVVVLHEEGAAGLAACSGGVLPRTLSADQSPSVPRVLCLACAITQGRRPSPAVRAPFTVPDEVLREVAGPLGRRRHLVAVWVRGDGSLLRSSPRCGAKGGGMRTQAEWDEQWSGAAPRLGALEMCQRCTDPVPGRRVAAS